MYAGAERHDAQDAVQTVMIRYIRYISGGGIAEIDNPLRYFATAVIRQVRSQQRERARYAEQLTNDRETAGDPIAVADMNVWEGEQWVNELIGALPPAQREVVRLVYEGLTPTEIAELLGNRPEAVRQSLFMARKTLRRRLDEP
jgi:RNA polymerase sigma factor (sigma-70 family)